MRRVLLLALLLIVPALAANPFPVALPRPADILKMGYVGFDAWAQEQVPDLTDAQRDSIAVTYNGLRRQQNDRMLGSLSDVDRVNFQVVSHLLDDWRDARIAHAVSGTPHSIPRERAGTADLLASALAAWRAPAGPEAAAVQPLQDRKEAGLLRQLQAELPKLPPAPRSLIGQYVSHEAAAWQ